ncbi:MAG: hypothetical protein ACRC8A_04745 [Microcoleaceae cyanobacterium]
MNDVTLQINLSAGDIDYASITVPALSLAHRSSINEVLAIVDCCRPQKTKVLDPDQRFPEPQFSHRIERICAIAEELKAKSYLDRVIYLYPNDPIIQTLSEKYMGGLIQETHDFRGAGLMSYLAGFEIPESRYVLHYDADMLLYQSADWDWSIEAIEVMNKCREAVVASPRPSPPFSQCKNLPDAPSLHTGRPYTVAQNGRGWLNDWFNTQCLLIDQDKLSTYLPLFQGKTFLQFLAFKYLQRTLPKSPEMMFIRRIGGSGGRRLMLTSEKAWILHPLTKPTRYIELLPRIQKAVSEGIVPDGQRGYENINLSEWENFFRY